MSEADLLTIRAAALGDVPAIAAVYADAVQSQAASYELEPPSVEVMAARLKATIEDGYPYLVAARDQRVVGYAYASAFRTRPAYRFLAENSVYVAPTEHRRGVGRQLMERLLNELERLGFRQVIAVVGDSQSNVASIALHRALGFRLIGTIEGSGWKFDGWRDTALLQKALAHGSTTPPEADAAPERRWRTTR